jgi:transketolase N-terminal domain/subunit
MSNELEQRIIDISYKNHLSHIGSCLNTVNFLEHTYETKEKDATVVLANAHAGLALYCVLEKQGLCKAEEMLKKHGIHATRDVEHGIEVSGGSLGQAETIAVGMALADRTKNVYLITSDGACAEGSVWEALRIAGEQKLENLRVAVIANGYGGYGEIDTNTLDTRLNMFFPTFVVRTNLFQFSEWLQGIDAHYVIMTKEMYKEITT